MNTEGKQKGIKGMTKKKLIEKSKLWLVLHGLKEFTPMTCKETKCKYVSGEGLCTNHKRRKLIRRAKIDICLTWLDDTKEEK